MRAHLPAALLLIPLLPAVAMPLVGLVRRSLCRLVTLLALTLLSVASLATLREVLRAGPIRYAFGGWAPPLGIEWVADGLSALVLSVVSTLALLALLYGGPSIQRELAHRIVPFSTLVLLLVSGLTGIVLAADLFNLFVFVEVASLATYALVGVAGGRALLSAFRYLILGTMGASLYLLGVAFLYAVTGTLNMADLSTQVPHLLQSKAVLWGLVLILVGLAVKMALMPLHGWLPDAYTYAPDAVSPLIAPLVTKVALYALVRISYWVLGAEAAVQRVPILAYLGMIGAAATLIGALLAFSQQTVKRMFAYAGISHIGLTVLGISLGNQTGFAGGIFYLINDAVMQASLFFIAGTAIYEHGAHELTGLVRLRRRMPWTLTALVVTALSMVGFPPTGGFFGKWYLVLGALDARNYLAVAAILMGTLLTLAYFAKVLEKVFLEAAPSQPAPAQAVWHAEAPWPMRISMGLATIAILGLGLFSDQVVSVILGTALPRGL